MSQDPQYPQNPQQYPQNPQGPQGPQYPQNQPGPGWNPANPPAPPMPVKQKSWFARHKILTAGLVVVALIVVGGMIGGDKGGSGGTSGSSAASGGGDTKADPPKKEDTKAKKEEPKQAGLNTPVRDGKFEFVVTKVAKNVPSIGSEPLEHKAQGQYVMITVTVKNVGNQSQGLSDSAQKLLDDAGRTFQADSSAAMYLKDNQVLYTPINPGNSVTGVIVFDMPKDANPTQIELHDSMFSGGVKVALS